MLTLGMQYYAGSNFIVRRLQGVSEVSIQCETHFKRQTARQCLFVTILTSACFLVAALESMKGMSFWWQMFIVSTPCGVSEIFSGSLIVRSIRVINKAIKEQHFVQLIENKRSLTKHLVVFLLWLLANTTCWVTELILALKKDDSVNDYAIFVGLTCLRTTFFSLVMLFISFMLIRFSEPPS